jgi:multiple sugar transport system permease protein
MMSIRARGLAGDDRRSRRRLLRGDERFAYLAVLPVIAVLAVLLLYPVISAIYLSFSNSNGVTSSFVGLQNYTTLLRDQTFWRVLLNNLLFLVSVPLILIASLVAAILVYEHAWGWRFFRVVFFVPSVLSTVVIGILFRGLFAYDGPVNRLLLLAHVAPVNWLGNTSTAIAVIVLALVWSSFGYGMLILLAGLSNVDPAIYEAGTLDGATWLQRLRHLTLPMISPVLRFVSIINVTYTFTSLFGFIFVMTSGGPGYATTTLDYFIYLKGFATFDFGGAAALAFILFAIIVALTIAQFRIFRPSD